MSRVDKSDSYYFFAIDLLDIYLIHSRVNMAKSTCENNLTIGGTESELQKFVDWVESQTHEQAPDAYWATLYNLEQESNKLVRADRQTWLNQDVYEGSPDHGYGVARFQASKTSISLNFPSYV